MLRSENHNSTLGWLIDPVLPREFFEEYNEKKTLLVQRQESSRWVSLLTVDDIDAILAGTNNKFPEIKMAFHGEVNVKDYTGEQERINPMKLYQRFADGYTIMLNQLHNRVPALAFLCQAMEREFCATFQTNIYVTPPNARGFVPHYDSHAVFILQVQGSKHWRIYEKAAHNPMVAEEFPGLASKPGMEFELNAGDLLYIPSGVIHEATTNDELSIHITLGMMSKKWCDFIAEALLHCTTGHSLFRDSMPPGYISAQEKQENFYDYYRKLIETLADRAIFDQAFNTFSGKFISSRKPLLHGQMKQIRDHHDLPLDNRLKARENISYRVRETKNAIQIECFESIISLPARLKMALDFILSARSFTIDEIPGKIDFELKIVLIQRLIREGMICFCP